MIELEVGSEIEMEYGNRAKILDVIGRSEQGVVYLVEVNRIKLALKWYNIKKIDNPEEFRQNIKNNISAGAPNNKFLWPKYLTKPREDGYFGYVMELKPDNFDSFVDIMNDYKVVKDPETGHLSRKPARFTSLYAMVTAAINIVNAFRKLHAIGKYYHSLNDGAFFINVDTGAVFVGDCDNVGPEGRSFGIISEPGYLAPELVMGKAEPSLKTDYYSLAALLFKLLFRGDPMEGKKVVMDVSLDDDYLIKYYGENAQFIYDPNNDSNRPVRGIHDNIIKFWQTYPDYIKNAFILSFTKGLKEPDVRIVEDEWQRLFIRLRSEMISCMCGRTNFTSMFDKKDDVTYKCPRCGTEFTTLAFTNKDYRVPLYVGCRFFECEVTPGSDDFLSVAGELVENKLRPGVLGIKNCSERTWKARMPDGAYYDIGPGKGFPIWQGLEIDFKGVKAHI